MRYADMPVLHKVNGVATPHKLEDYNWEKDVYYRLQDAKYEIGTQSWGMIYSSAEEALEDGSTVLDGKSCWSTSREMLAYTGTADPDAVVLVVRGYYVEEGHDGEPVVEIEEVLEIWDQEQFIEAANIHRSGDWEEVAA